MATKVSTGNKIVLQNAYIQAIKFTAGHYENFPVISFFLPKNIKKHIAVIYQFARQADDIADEGDCLPDERLKQLELYESKLKEALTGHSDTPFWGALYNTIIEKGLTEQNFYNLLNAFKQDVHRKRYANHDQILDYCKKSANPVGRLILELFGIKDSRLFEYSDCICTALQLTNFYQDISIDFERGRVYISQDELMKFGVSEKTFENKENNINFRNLMAFLILRTEDLFKKGKPLVKHLPHRLKYQIYWTILGGESILNKIRKMNFDVLNNRPKLSKMDFVFLFIKSLIPGGSK